MTPTTWDTVKTLERRGFSHKEACLLACRYRAYTDYALSLRPLAPRIIMASIIDNQDFLELYPDD